MFSLIPCLSHASWSLDTLSSSHSAYHTWNHETWPSVECHTPYHQNLMTHLGQTVIKPARNFLPSNTHCIMWHPHQTFLHVSVSLLMNVNSWWDMRTFYLSSKQPWLGRTPVTDRQLAQCGTACHMEHLVLELCLLKTYVKYLLREAIFRSTWKFCLLWQHSG